MPLNIVVTETDLICILQAGGLIHGDPTVIHGLLRVDSPLFHPTRPD